MTEKRFTIKPSMIVDDVTVIIDNQKEYTFPVLDSTLNYMFCKALNELADENKKLKQEIKGFEGCSHNFGLLYDEVKNKVEELSKANKELKSENVNIMNDLDYYLLKSRSCEEGLFEKDREIAKLEKENKELKEKNKEWIKYVHQLEMALKKRGY